MFEHPIFFGRPFADVGALQTAVMVDVWQRDYSLLSQVMSHYQHIKERKERKKSCSTHYFHRLCPTTNISKKEGKKEKLHGPEE